MKEYRDTWQESLPLLGMVVRFDSYEGPGNIFNALSQLKRCDAPFRCTLVGPEIDESNSRLRGIVELAGA